MQDSIFIRLSALKKHDHICHIYANDTERYEIGASYILHGLRSRQKCFFVSDREAPGELTDRLIGNGVSCKEDKCSEFEQIVFENLPGEPEDAESSAARLIERIDKSTETDENTTARVLISQSEHSQAMSGPEKLWKNAYINKMCFEKPIIVMSQLSVDRLSSRDLLSAMETYEYIVRKSIIYKSPFYSGREFIVENINDEYRKLDSLSKREMNILRLITSGLSNPAIAGELSISVKTVETHRANIMKKLDVHNLVDLVKFSMRNGIS